MGGVLLWKDRQNYLYLERGANGQHEITFTGCLDNQDVIVGRGCLPTSTGRVHLRLKRTGQRVNALCSADGETWYTVGHMDFPVTDPVDVGLLALGHINRAIHPGAFPDGAAIRFESFRLWYGDSNRSPA